MVRLESNVQNRIDYVDIAKGLGIILVVCSHSLYPQMMFWANLFFIPVFFVLSGYTMHTLDLKKKARSLLKPYFVFNLLIIVLMWLSGLKDVTFNHVLGVLYSRFALYPNEIMEENHVLMNVGNSPTWFLTSMFLAYVMLYPLLKVKKYRQIMIAVYLLVTIVMSYLPVLLPWSLDISFLMALFIYLGSVLREKDAMNMPLKYIVVVLAGYVLLAYFNGYCNISIRNYGVSVLVYALGAVLGSVLLIKFSICIANTKLNAPLRALGKNSLVIFCIQIPILFITAKILNIVLNIANITLCMEITAVLQVIITLCIGYVCSITINKYIPKLIK